MFLNYFFIFLFFIGFFLWRNCQTHKKELSWSYLSFYMIIWVLDALNLNFQNRFKISIKRYWNFVWLVIQDNFFLSINFIVFRAIKKYLKFVDIFMRLFPQILFLFLIDHEDRVNWYRSEQLKQVNFVDGIKVSKKQ